VLEKKLNALGITQFAQVAAFTADDIERVDAELNFKGRIEREDWLSQAKALAEGK
jgi:predicted flap endonuclease-1-like 5' DNA nuclease